MIKHTVKLVTVIVLLFFLYFIVVNFHDKKTTLDKEDSFTNKVKPQKNSLESYLDGLDSDTMDSMLDILSETNSKEEAFLKIKKLLENN